MILKDELFNESTVTMLAKQLKTAYPSFQTDKFVTTCINGFEPLELKARMSFVRKMLYKHLPKDYQTTLYLFHQAFESQEQVGHFIYGAVLEYIEVYGCTDDYVDCSIIALGDLTHIMSSEFAIRPYLNQYPDKTLAKAIEWTSSSNTHKRRLASEGTRPSLPWAGKITLDYHKTEPILDALHNDSERYVVRSVANHLNDISKVDPNFVIDKLREWNDAKNKRLRTIEYIDRHSLRTLLKKGNPAALEYMGYKINPKITLFELRLIDNIVSIGDNLEFEIDIQTGESVKLMIDYIITYPTKLGKMTSKVYKWKNFEASSSTTFSFKGKRSFKEISTRKMRPGRHEISIQINGHLWQTEAFTLKE